MESSSKPTRKRSTGVAQQDKKKKTKVTVLEPTYEAVSLIPAKVIIKDAPSGTVYVFPKAGAKVKVASADVEHLKGKKQINRPCCGAGGSNLAFELVEV